MNDSSLTLFHPLIQDWFRERVGRPTEVQEQAWPSIAAGGHVLVTAPTGSGKTLTAFLWAIHQFVTGRWPAGQTSVLYVSPLKALNNDIQRNLLGPLGELKQRFEEAGESFPPVQVVTRSGDTPQSDRRRMLRHPPEILITTPESLNLLISTSSGQSVLANLRTVILDEIHAVVANKRGTHLITAVDRLVLLSGEFQRVALSATVKPLKTVAQFIGGFRMEADGPQSHYAPRDVSVIGSPRRKEYDIGVRFQERSDDLEKPDSLWDPLVEEFKRTISRHRSTLLFVNNRRLSEKLTLMINSAEDHPLAYAHHGSLSREIRTEVEGKLKTGDLKAIVATNSLELGIDIGALDEVLLIQSPPSVSSAVQRIGRAGHRVGEISRGRLYPTFDQDLLESAVLAAAVCAQDIEEIRPVSCPLDVLAQVMVSMVGTRTWDIETLYRQLLASYPYRHLSRRHFELVLNMLAGRYAGSRIRELKPRVSIDRLDQTVAARKGALLAIHTSGGMIPDRGYYQLRHQGSGALIGDLDEEFVWEAKIGQHFTLGTQNWRIERITHNDVFVVTGNPRAAAAPFWKGEQRSRDFHFSSRIAEFLAEANTRLDDPAFEKVLSEVYRLDGPAAEHLLAYLKKQKRETGCDLPHRHHLVVEYVRTGPGGLPGNQVILHTLWGGRVNRPLAMALEAAWEGRFGHKIEVYAGNDSIVLQLAHDIAAEELLSLVHSGNIETLLRSRLEGSGFFGARFRECAGRALLLTRQKIRQRLPLWMIRLRSQKLLDAVQRFGDFPILLEAWRTCLQDEFDLGALQQLLTEIESGAISISECRTAVPSPFARNLSWKQISEYMYRGDEPLTGRATALRSDLLREVVFGPGLRPTVSREIVDAFLEKRQRLSPGYAPSTPRELVDWVVERLLLPEGEWQQLVAAMRRDYGMEADSIIQSASEKLVRLHPQEASQSLIGALETVPQIVSVFYGEGQSPEVKSLDGDETLPPEALWESAPAGDDQDEQFASLIEEWLRFYGPLSLDTMEKTLWIDREQLTAAVQDLIESEVIVSGVLVVGGAEDDICDAVNFETLLRLARKERVPEFSPLPLDHLSLFMAAYQGVVGSSKTIDGLYHALEQLSCYPATAALWESEILPARLQAYQPTWLDLILQESDLRWIGRGEGKIAFCSESDLDLLAESGSDVADNSRVDASGDDQENKEAFVCPPLDGLFPDPAGKYDFSALLRHTKRNPAELSDCLWRGVWHGRITNDTFHSLRRGIQNQFDLPESRPPGGSGLGRRHGRRSRLSRWRDVVQYPGNWFLLPEGETDTDILVLEELKKDRVRLLLDRYGLLFRELLVRESAPFRWPGLFRSLRLMELSGEVLSGYFFEGIPGPQFISHQAFRLLQKKLPGDAVYWINAADPASCCGLQVEGLRQSLPRRVDSTHLVFHGARLVMVSQRNGKSLFFHVSPDDLRLQEYLGPLHHLLTRAFQPLRRIAIETINDNPAPESPYVDALRTAFDAKVDYKEVTLYRNR